MIITLLQFLRTVSVSFKYRQALTRYNFRLIASDGLPETELSPPTFCGNWLLFLRYEFLDGSFLQLRNLFTCAQFARQFSLSN